MKAGASVLREATIPMSLFSRSAFGVGLSLLRAEDERGHCPCSLLDAGEPPPEECRSFRVGLFAENAATLVRCPAGLAMALLPVSPGGKGKAVLLSDAFLHRDEDIPAEGKTPAALSGRLKNRRAEMPRVSPDQADLLMQFMESLGTMFSLFPNGNGRASLTSLKEDLWRDFESSFTLVGVSQDMTRLREALPSLANSGEPLLIESEQGNGRHLIAALTHRAGGRREGPFISERLSTLPESLHEKEILGPQRDGEGGLLHLAGGGTIFLDGIESLSVPAQKSLALWMGKMEAEASGREPGAARVIAATDKNLGDLARRGRFRSDLHRRLSRFSVAVPPLRERKEDIPLLARHLLERLARREGRQAPSLDNATLSALQEYPWPGNVKELENELARAAAFSGATVELGDFSPPVQHTARPPQVSSTNIRDAVGSLETEMISRTLADTNWNKSKAARILGLSRLGLQKKIDRYGLDRRR